MHDPEVEFTVFEDFDLVSSPLQQPGSELQHQPLSASPTVNGVPRLPRCLYLGRKVCESSRHLIEKHDLKKRPYISTTSMDAELALISANLALAGPDRLFLDPFVGTGGLLVAAAELGAVTIGSDIDGRTFRGNGRGVEKGIGANFRQYEIEDRFGDCVISDLTNSPLRDGSGTPADRGWLDGIICDPPYGVREGLKVLGARKDNANNSMKEHHQIDGVPAYTLAGYVPPKRPYSFILMLDDLLDFAVRTLVEDGRLAFWMPSANAEDQEIALPAHRSMEFMYCCVQAFNKWSRRLLVFRKRRRAEGTEHVECSLPQDKTRQSNIGTTADDLNPFRKRYFQGFASDKADQHG